MMPTLQTSTPASYGWPQISSGAIQYGVPRTDVRVGRSLDSTAVHPKSASFTEPSEKVEEEEEEEEEEEGGCQRR